MFNQLSSIIILSLITSVHGKPYEAYPIDKQLPPVARVNEQFTFQISNDTYRSTGDSGTQITYNAYDLPNWLTFDSNTRTFSGIPPSTFLDDTNEGIRYFDIVLGGTDELDKQSLNSSCRLVVSNKPSIQLAENFNLLALLKNFGNTNGEDALILSPNEHFNISFDKGTFENNGTIVAYYGRSKKYNAPLPPWIGFDEGILEFVGTAPIVNSAIAPQTIYSFVLIATDIAGYSGIEVPFQIAVGAHKLTTSIQNTIIINVTSSGSFSYELPLNYVYFDNHQITSKNLGGIDLVNAPSWVSLRNDSLVGNLPGDAGNGTFSVVVHDNYGDAIYWTFEVTKTRDLFSVAFLPDLYATRGTWFQYSFLPSQFTDYAGTEVSVAFPKAQQDSNWLKFSSSNLTLSGNVPADFDALSLDLVATRGDFTQELQFEIFGVDKIASNNTFANTTSTINSTTPTTSATPTTSSNNRTSFNSTRAGNFSIPIRTSLAPSATSYSLTTPSATHSGDIGTFSPINKSRDDGRTKKIIIAVVCSVVPALLLALLLVLFLMFWRRRSNDGHAKQLSDDEKGFPPISRPSPINPSNRPNQNSNVVRSPFEDSLGVPIAKDAISLSSHSSSDIDHEKNLLGGSSADLPIESLYDNPFDNKSNDKLLPKAPQTAKISEDKSEMFYNPYNRSSSLYVDSEPTKRKSWRYNLRSSTQAGRNSVQSLKTMTTEEFLNTEIRDTTDIPKDPKKSTLGPRDSAFWNSQASKSGEVSQVNDRYLYTSNGAALSPLEENRYYAGNDSNIEWNQLNARSFDSSSTSSSDDFVPVKRGDDYRWVRQPEISRKASKKRYIDLREESQVNLNQARDIEGRDPEML